MEFQIVKEDYCPNIQRRFRESRTFPKSIENIEKNYDNETLDFLHSSDDGITKDRYANSRKINTILFMPEPKAKIKS